MFKAINILNIVWVGLWLVANLVCSGNSRTSTLWRLNSDETKIVEASSPFINHPLDQQPDNKESSATTTEDDDDPVFNIITSTVHYYGHTWMKQAVVGTTSTSDTFCNNCGGTTRHKIVNDTGFQRQEQQSVDEEQLDCGKPVNFTFYDNLVGVMNRQRHPNVPEPQLALIFPHHRHYDLVAMERRLRRARRDRPKSVQLYTQIGNLLRAQGDSRRAIECFRRALAVAPHHSDALLSLARVLFALQYMDDAIYLTRRSLEVLQAGAAGSGETGGGAGNNAGGSTGSVQHNAWRHYFTLGEIFRAYGQYGKAQAHLRHALALRPGFEPATAALRDIVLPTASAVHAYTLLIIVCLVFGVLLVILSSVDVGVKQGVGVNTGGLPAGKGGRFNRAAAMQSLRAGGRNGKPLHT